MNCKNGYCSNSTSVKDIPLKRSTTQVNMKCLYATCDADLSCFLRIALILLIVLNIYKILIMPVMNLTDDIPIWAILGPVIGVSLLLYAF